MSGRLVPHGFGFREIFLKGAPLMHRVVDALTNHGSVMNDDFLVERVRPSQPWYRLLYRVYPARLHAPQMNFAQVVQDAIRKVN